MRSFALLVAGFLVFSASAQPASKPVPQELKPSETPTPLAGPKVDEAAAAATLVQYTMSGRLRRLDRPAEEAALEIMRLSADEASEVEHILAERAKAIDKVVAENIPLLVLTQQARESNDQKAQREQLAALLEKFQKVRERGTLRDEIAYVLSEANATRFEQLVQDYWQAVVRDEVRDRAAKGAEERGRGILLRESMLTFGQEIRRSYERQVQAKTEQLEAFLKSVEATPEQEEKIRKITADAYQASGGKPTLAQRRETFTRVLRELSPEQKAAVLRELYRPDAP